MANQVAYFLLDLYANFIFESKNSEQICSKVGKTSIWVLDEFADRSMIPKYKWTKIMLQRWRLNIANTLEAKKQHQLEKIAQSDRPNQKLVWYLTKVVFQPPLIIRPPHQNC
jgi:hypothetical protein